jgi:hypothetical protein
LLAKPLTIMAKTSNPSFPGDFPCRMRAFFIDNTVNFNHVNQQMELEFYLDLLFIWIEFTSLSNSLVSWYFFNTEPSIQHQELWYYRILFF